MLKKKKSWKMRKKNQYLNECHEMHALVLCFVQKASDPASTFLKASKRFEVQQHTTHHAWHSCYRLQHHGMASIFLL
jgi:hypothetical protein